MPIQSRDHLGRRPQEGANGSNYPDNFPRVCCSTSPIEPAEQSGDEALDEASLAFMREMFNTGTQKV